MNKFLSAVVNLKNTEKALLTASVALFAASIVCKHYGLV